MAVDGRKVRFLLDCGATVNLVPATLVRELGRMAEIRPAQSKLRMFDNTQLTTAGMITLDVKHLKTGQAYSLDFYVTDRHKQAILGCVRRAMTSAFSN